MMPTTDSDRGLLHPVYLDIPMLITFLAALSGGVSFEDETTVRSSSGGSREREGGGGIRLPALGALLGFDASGRMSSKTQDENSEEVRAVRQHTAASLFNALHDALRHDHLLKAVVSAADLAEVAPGDIVEMAGNFVGNPLQELLNFFAQALPYFMLSEPSDELKQAAELDVNEIQGEVQRLISSAKALRAEAAEAGRSGNPSKRAEAATLIEQAESIEADAKEKADRAVAQLQPLVEFQQQHRGVAMFQQMRDDLANSAVHDAVIQAADLQAVLTLSAEFLTEPTQAYLRAGEFKVIGKVTKVLGTGDSINLMRRTVLGSAGPDFGRDLIEHFREMETFKLDTFDPIIEAPALQIIPLAVYI